MKRHYTHEGYTLNGYKGITNYAISKSEKTEILGDSKDIIDGWHHFYLIEEEVILKVKLSPVFNSRGKRINSKEHIFDGQTLAKGTLIIDNGVDEILILLPHEAEKLTQLVRSGQNRKIIEIETSCGTFSLEEEGIK